MELPIDPDASERHRRNSSWMPCSDEALRVRTIVRTAPGRSIAQVRRSKRVRRRQRRGT